MQCAFSAAPQQCTNTTLPLCAAGAVLVLAPAVARCTSRITMPATQFRQPEPMALYGSNPICARLIVQTIMLRTMPFAACVKY